MDITTAKRVLEQMRGCYERYLAMVATLDSPNPQDTKDIKCAIVGFSLYSATENWDLDHYRFVVSRLEESADMYGDRVRLLYAMCLGGLCGLAFERKISEREFQLSDMQLPGHLMALGGKIGCEQEGARDG